MNVQWLEDLIALAECLNFSRAAEKRNVTQPAFSRRIKSLEDATGADLIDRSSHRLELTAAGVAVLAAAKDIDARLKRLDRELEQVRTVASALTFASTHALSFSFFPNWFKALPSTASSVPVHLLADNMRACERMMSEGRAQFLLCHSHPSMEIMLPDISFRTAELAKDRIVPIAKSENGLPLYRLEDAAEKEVPLLSFDERSGIGRILFTAFRDRLSELKLRPAFSSHLAVALKALAADGKGIAWAPLSLIDEELRNGTLAIAGGSEWSVEVSVILLRPRERQSELAEQFWHLATRRSPTAAMRP